MERDPSLSRNENDADSNVPDKGKRRNRRRNFHAPVPIEAPKTEARKEKGAGRRPEPSALDKALAELAVKKQAEETTGTDSEAPKARRSRKEKEEPQAAETAADTDEKTTTEEVGATSTRAEATEVDPDGGREEDESGKEPVEERLESRDLRPNELSVGEGFIDLSGNAPLEERVIPLHGETEDTEPVEATTADVEMAEPAEVPQYEEVATTVPVIDAVEVHAGEEADIPADGEAEAQPGAADPTEQVSAQHEAPVFASQPEQQYQSASAPESAPEPTYPAAGETPPPVFTPPVEVLPPEPEMPYAASMRSEGVVPPDMYASWPPAYPSSGEAPATKRDIEEALYYAEKQGQNRGVLAGLLVGGGYEHLKHRRREKRQGKLLKQQNKRLKQASEQLSQSQQDLEAATTVNRQESRFNAPNTAFWTEQSPLPTNPAERLPAPTPEQALQRSPEQLPVVVADEAAAERLAVPADHRLETSAWHTIEVDSRTGQAVENPTFAYGAEYYHERAQENQGEVANGSADATGSSAGQTNGSDAVGDGASSGQYLQQSSQIPSASTQGPPSATERFKSAASSVKDAAKSAGSLTQSNDGPIWPWVVALVVIVILLAIVL